MQKIQSRISQSYLVSNLNNIEQFALLCLYRFCVKEALDLGGEEDAIASSDITKAPFVQ